jgi:CheY-like chemotaxis protein
MPQLRIDRGRQAALNLFDPFRDLPEPLRVSDGIAPAFFVGNDGQALTQRLSQLGQCFLHRKSLKRGALSRKRPFMGSSSAKKILIVDDDVGLMRVIREALTSFLRCEVDTSPNPEYGFELALTKTYDLLIFDFSMPMIDGAMLFFLIGKAYNHAQPPRVVPPLLLVTGRGDEERAQELLKEAGVRGLVAKPFVINRLIEKVKECLPGIEPARGV